MADVEHGIRYLKEDTIARFLEIPDILHVSPVVFHMVSCIGAFPFLQDAPAVLGLEQVVMVITIMTERYSRILAKGATDRRRLLFRSLAVYDRKLSEMMEDKRPADGKDGITTAPTTASGGTETGATGFAIDEAGEEESDEGDGEDDDLVLAAFESLDYLEVFKQSNRETTHGAMIPADNFRKIVMLLLLVAPLSPQERLSQFSSRVTGDELNNLRSTAESILAAFLNVEQSPGIEFSVFNSIIPISFPFLFNGFNGLFEHFLFSKSLDFSKHKTDQLSPPDKPSEFSLPLLQDTASILNLNTLSQLSFFIPGTMLFRRLRLLYSGDNDGFSSK